VLPLVVKVRGTAFPYYCVKSGNIDAGRYQFLWQKCTKLDFSYGFASDPDAQLYLRGLRPTFNEREGKGKQKGRIERREERRKKGNGKGSSFLILFCPT